MSSVSTSSFFNLDVKTTFLASDLKDEIYMDQPKGFVLPNQEHLVYRLKKSLYELKQEPWYWKFYNLM